MHQHFALWIIGEDLHIFRVGEIDFAEFLRVVRAAGVELANQVVIDLHARSARGERLARIHAQNHRKGIFFFFCGNSMSVPALVDQQDIRAHTGESHGRALVNFDFQAIGNKPHHAGRGDPGNLLQLLFAWSRGKEDVAADVSAHDFHDLRAGHILQTGDFDVVARVDAKTPRVFAVMIKAARPAIPQKNHDQVRATAPQVRRVAVFFGE